MGPRASKGTNNEALYMFLAEKKSTSNNVSLHNISFYNCFYMISLRSAAALASNKLCSYGMCLKTENLIILRHLLGVSHILPIKRTYSYSLKIKWKTSIWKLENNKYHSCIPLLAFCSTYELFLFFYLVQIIFVNFIFLMEINPQISWCNFENKNIS